MRRRGNKRTRTVYTMMLVVVACGVGWWFWPGGEETPVAPERPDNSVPLIAETAVFDPPQISGEGVPDPPDEILTPRVAEAKPKPSAETKAEPPAPPIPAGPDKLSSNPRINASLVRYKAGQRVAARTELNRMLEISRDSDERAELRRHLRVIADEMIFSRKVFSDDPLFETYQISTGDYLLNIGKQYKTPYEAIMLINGISNPSRIQAGQKIKTPHGPFHVRIHSSEFRLDVYLQDVYVRSFPVGLGGDQGTPLGRWRVKNRLPNPTYYPPPSVDSRRIIPPNDPTNPLGEHWIGMTGLDGDALDCVGYGIHGTIEPESIGKAVSLGCVRMHNADVEFLYKLTMPGASTVTTLP